MRTSAGIKCCYFLKLVIKSRTLKSVSKIKTPRRVLKSVVMYRHDTWSSIKKDEVMLNAWERKILCIVYGPVTE
jgi:hypothetical protein